MYYYYTTSGLRRGHIVAEPSISYCAQVQKLFVPPRAELFVYLGSTDDKISQKGTETTIGRGFGGLLSSAGTSPPGCQPSQASPAQVRLRIQGRGRRSTYDTRRELGPPSGKSLLRLAQASEVRPTTRRASPRVRPATAPTLSKSARRLERISDSRSKVSHLVSSTRDPRRESLSRTFQNNLVRAD